MANNLDSRIENQYNADFMDRALATDDAFLLCGIKNFILTLYTIFSNKVCFLESTHNDTHLSEVYTLDIVNGKLGPHR